MQTTLHVCAKILETRKMLLDALKDGPKPIKWKLINKKAALYLSIQNNKR